MLTHFAVGDYLQGGGDFSFTSPATGGEVNGTSSYVASRAARFRPVMRIGTGVEYTLPTSPQLITTLYLNYMHGFMTTDQILVTSTAGDGVVGYHGSGWSLDVGIKFPFKFGDKGLCGIRPEKPD
jgi:hypothetical protein